MITEHHLTVPRTARYFTVGGDAHGVRGPLDLWIACHGYGQLASNFVEPFARIATPSRQIVAPEGLSRFYLERSRVGVNTQASIGATWMTREDRDAEIADQISYLDLLHDTVVQERSGRVRLRVLGFSQGVATVSRWLVRGSRVQADEIILWAGAFPPDIDVAHFARRVGAAQVLLVVGARDTLAPWAAAEETLGRFTAEGIAARLLTFEGGHRLDDATLASIAGSIAAESARQADIDVGPA